MCYLSMKKVSLFHTTHREVKKLGKLDALELQLEREGTALMFIIAKKNGTDSNISKL